MAEAFDWELVAAHAAWAPRDSCGEVVHDGRMWLLGGWFTSHDVNPRDVWSSANGTDWQLATPAAGWLHGDLPASLVFDGKMWMMGGWHRGRLEGASGSNQVWHSTDGATWQCATDDAPWCPRVGPAGVVFNDRMWILGGAQRYFDAEPGHLLNDVWSSADGVHWTCATENAPWAPRAFHAAVAFNDRIWVLAGGNYLNQYWGYNDVWSSADGVHWTRVTEGAPWEPRLWFSSVVYRDRMWVLGGWANDPSHNMDDVWHTADGEHWSRLQTETIWSARHEHSGYVFQDALWLVAGMAWPLVNDVWRLRLPEGWRG